MDLIDRARAYVAKMPEAVSGQDGHGATFAVAKVLLHFFGLPRDQAAIVLEEYNARCAPPWSAKELKHKLDSAAKSTWKGARATESDKGKATSTAAKAGQPRTLRTGNLELRPAPTAQAGQSRTVRTDFLNKFRICAQAHAPDTEETSDENVSEVSEPVEPEKDKGKQPHGGLIEDPLPADYAARLAAAGIPVERSFRVQLERVDEAERNARAGYSTWINAKGTAFAAAKSIVDGQARLEIGRQLSKQSK